MAWLACTAETDKEKKIEEPKYELVKVDSKNNALLDEEGNRKYYRGEDGTSDPSSGLTLEEITESKEAKKFNSFQDYNNQFRATSGYMYVPTSDSPPLLKGDDETTEVVLDEVVATIPQMGARELGSLVFTQDLSLLDTKKVFDKLGKDFIPQLELLNINISDLNFDSDFINLQGSLIGEKLTGDKGVRKNPVLDLNPFSVEITDDQQNILNAFAGQATQDIVLNTLANDRFKKELKKCENGGGSNDECAKSIYNKINYEPLKYLEGAEKDLAENEIELKKAIDSGDQKKIDKLTKKNERIRKRFQGSAKYKVYNGDGSFSTIKIKKDGTRDFSDASPVAEKIEKDAITELSNNRIENNGDIGILQGKQSKLYFEILALAGIVEENFENVKEGKGKGLIQNIKDSSINMFTGGSLDDIRKMAETGILPKNLKTDYFKEGSGLVLGDTFNKKINEYLVLSRALLLNTNPMGARSNYVLEGVNRKFVDISGTNLGLDSKNQISMLNDVANEVGYELFTEEETINERLKVSIGELTTNVTLDLMPLIGAMYFNKKAGFEKVTALSGRLGQYFINLRGRNNFGGNTYKNIVQTVFGTENGASGIKEMLKLGLAEEQLNLLTGQEKMDASFGFILGSTQSVMERKMVASALNRLSKVIPGVKYLTSRTEGTQLLINNIIGAGTGTAAMTFTELAEQALKGADLDAFREVFYGEYDPNLPPEEQKAGAYDKLISTFLSFGVIGMGNSKISGAIYRDLKAAKRGMSSRESKASDVVGMGSDKYNGPKEGNTSEQNSKLSKQRKEEIEYSTNKAIEKVKKENLTPEKKQEKIDKILKAKDNLLEVVDYRDTMFGLESNVGYGSNKAKEAANAIEVWGENDNFKDLSTKNIDDLAVLDPILIRRALMDGPKDMSLKQASVEAEAIKIKAKFYSEYADSMVGQNRSGEGGKLRDKVINTLKEADIISAKIKQIDLSSTKAEYGIAAKLQKANLEARFQELQENLNGLQTEAGNYTLKQAVADKAALGTADVKVNLLSAKEYKEKGFEESEAVFNIQNGEIFYNIDAIKSSKNTSAVAHEVAHKSALNLFKDLNGEITPEGRKILEQFKDLIPPDQIKIIDERVSKSYKDKNKDQQLEEYFAIFSERVSNGQIEIPGAKILGKVTDGKSAQQFLLAMIQETKSINEGTRSSYSPEILEIISDGSKNSIIKGAQYSKPIQFKKDEVNIKNLMEAEGLTREAAQARDLASQINSLVTTETKLEFKKQNQNNIAQGIMNGDFDSIFARGLTPEKIQMVRDEIAIRVVGRTEKGGFDPAKGKFSTWLYGNIEKAKLDVIKELAIESARPEYSLENNYKEAASVLDKNSLNEFELSGENSIKRRSDIKRILNLDGQSIDNVKRSISNIVFGKENVQGIQNLTRKDIQDIRRQFVGSKAADGGKIRKIILNKINEIDGGLATSSGAELIYKGISLSRMSNSLKGGGKGYEIFLEPVLKLDGTQARYSVKEANDLGIALEKGGSGPLKYKKRSIDDFIKDGEPTKEYLDWIQGKDIASGPRGRKNSIVDELTGEVGMEAMLTAMVDQKIVIPPVLDANGKIIEPARTEDLFPNATAEQKTKIASDAIVNFVADKIGRVYKNNKNLLYSKKAELTEFNKQIAKLPSLNGSGILDLAAFTELFQKQSKEFQNLLNSSAPGEIGYIGLINDLNVKSLEENAPLFTAIAKKGSVKYYNEYANYNQVLNNYKKYTKEKGLEYTPEKDLIQPEFNADGTRNAQNIVRTKGWMKDYITQFGPWAELTKQQKKYILGTIGDGKNLRKELGLVRDGRTTEQMLVDVFGKDVLTGEKIIDLPDVYQVAYNQATKTKFENLIENQADYTRKQLRDKFVELLVPKGKGIEYYDTMLDGNNKALEVTLKGFLGTYEKAKGKDKTIVLENIMNMLKLQTNHNSGIKGLFPITSILLEVQGSINKKGELTNKKLHFEHNKELFNFSKSFLEILQSKDSLKVKNEMIQLLTKDATQSIISEQLRFEKDATGSTIANSLDPDLATYIVREGAAANSIDLRSKEGFSIDQTVRDKYKEAYVNTILNTNSKNIKSLPISKSDVYLKPTATGDYNLYSKEAYNKKLDVDFNEILQRTQGIDASLKISRVQGKMEGAGRGGWMNMFYGAEDFGGLTYSILAGKGKRGEMDQAFFKDNLVTPYNRGVAKTQTYAMTLKRDYSTVLKRTKINEVIGKLPGKGNGLNKKIEGMGSFTYDQALRTYLWNKSGYEIPGISKVEKTKLIELVNENPELQAFGDEMLNISKNKKWTEPSEFWNTRNLTYDILVSQVDRARKGYIGEFTNNVDVIFSEANLNKLEATYGPAYRSALESSMRRMKSGSNRPGGGTATENSFMNWTNNSIGAIMFFNRRSAVLQTLSSVNFINWGDNNPIKAAGAFANIKQYGADFQKIWNSDKLKARRSGLGNDLNSSEIAAAIQGSRNKPAAALSALLKIGFTPTQIADSFAIASGGAAMYRNRTNTYLKEGFELKEAEAKAWEDFSRISEETQQSADASLISDQQSSTLGRLVLAFQNTPMQYTRMISKSARDLANNRGDFKTNVSKIAYYGVVQNMAFASLQNALFSEINGFDGDDASVPITPEQQAKKDKKVNRIINNMFDSVARGYGIYGAIGATSKNVVMKYMEEEGKDAFQRDHAKTLLEIINLSPPIGSKIRKVYNSIKTKEFNKDIIAERGMEVTYEGKINLSPSYSVAGSLVEGVTNVPLERTITEINSLVEALDDKNSAFQRLALLLGWRTWDVGASNEEMDSLRVDLKERKKEDKRKAKEEEKEKIRKQEEERKYLGKTDQEIKNIKQRDSLIGTNKSSQIETLIKLGLTKKEIRKLNLEEDRVKKIIELSKK